MNALKAIEIKRLYEDFKYKFHNSTDHFVTRRFPTSLSHRSKNVLPKEINTLENQILRKKFLVSETLVYKGQNT
ncbi:hypothetical protein BpHYR1_013374 [Brachionus plicatilis]|uniref:Uncharacterized protein n=1 Tax=Brachionus plicatilis TaxID=10195 RepID=A0A3M7SZN2_BRAPC|nr:hypothetical protein BpHYR1_013374 [Brachionus plicatilis]